jgi:RNA polymerase sigma factor (TIGR02999 family)
MSDPADDPISELVDQANRGDRHARDALFAALYRELHRLAEGHLRRSGGQLTLSATTLLHEAYLSIAARSQLAFPNERHFLSYASRAMRGLIIDYVRQKGAIKRGGELTFAPLEEGETDAAADPPVDFERLGQALDELALLDSSLAELVDLKFFCGLSIADIASIRRVSERTVKRDWAKARVLLQKAMGAGSS